MIRPSDTSDEIADKVRGALAEVGMDVETSLPHLLHVLGLKDDTGPLAALNPEAIQTRTFETLRQFRLVGSRRRPIVFAIEDLHWIDPATR